MSIATRIPVILALGSPELKAAVKPFLSGAEPLTPEQQTQVRSEILPKLASIIGWEQPLRLAAAVRLNASGRTSRSQWGKKITLDTKEFSLEKGSLVIGRDQKKARFCINSRLVSSKHAEIYFENDTYMIRDLGSRHGTKLNGNEIPRGGLPLKTDDHIVIGPVPIRVVLPEILYLEKNRDKIADVASNGEFVVMLCDDRQEAIAEKIERFIRSDSGAGWQEIPEEGGLQDKVIELDLEKKIKRLMGQYLPGLDEAIALSLLFHLTEGVAAVREPGQVRKVLRTGFVPAGFVFSRKIGNFQKHPGPKSIDLIPREFQAQGKYRELILAELEKSGAAKSLKAIGFMPEILVEKPWKGIHLPDFPQIQTICGQIREALTAPLPEPMDRPPGFVLQTPSDEILHPLFGIKLRKKPREENSTVSFAPTQALSAKDQELLKMVQQISEEGHPPPVEEGYFSGGITRPDKRFRGRFLLALTRAHAEDFWKYCQTILWPQARIQGVPLKYQMRAESDEYGHPHSALLRFHPEHEKAVFDWLVAMYHQLPIRSFQEDCRPFFTLPLNHDSGEMNGIFFAPELESQGVSRRDQQLFALKKGWRLSRIVFRRGELNDWEEFSQILAYSLKETGFDLENPVLTEEAIKQYPEILSHVRKP